MESRRIITGIRDSVTPDPSGYFTVEPEKRDGKYILKVIVERGSGIPYCYSKYGLVPQGVYVRVGNNTVMSTREHIRQMIKDSGLGNYITDLSIEQNLTFEFTEKTFSRNDVRFGELQKQSLGLARTDGRFTNLALILSDQCPYTTKVAIFEGTNKDKFKDRKEFTGSLFKQIDDVLAYINVYNRVYGKFEGVHRVDHPDYPHIALREIYINSIIHRDYYIHGSVIISMFDDRLEFMSLGGVMPGITYDLMLAGVSVSRNEKLVQIFYRLNLIEAFGTGIPRIFSAYEDFPIKPEIPIIDGGFLFRIPNMNYGQTNLNKNGNIVGSNEQRLLKIFPTESFNKKEAARALDISLNGAYKLLRRMTKNGVLNSIKSGKEWIYSVKL